MFQLKMSPVSSRLRLYKQDGFTLVELLVVVVILVLITSVVLVGSSRGQGGILLTNAAYEVAIMLREAQSYGSSAFKPGNIGTEVSVPYGVYIDETIPGSIKLFRDDNEDGLFNAVDDYSIEDLAFTGGIQIQQFCWNPGGGEVCSDTEGGTQTISVTFKRPNPDARVLSTGGTSCSAGCEYAIIRIVSPAGDTRAVQVYTTGQVAVLDS
jgi:prepilin-type N-terminal cleavage/methylation domain-containing protein